MDSKTEEKLSKFMSKILRHSPAQYGITLDESGYCEITDLLVSIKNETKWSNTIESDIKQVVENCPKQRYEINGTKIKANYGHSVQKLQYEEKKPPAILYHGTNTKVENLILKDGIKSMNRQFVHLSEGTEFATLAGERRGELLILKVDSKSAFEDGLKFHYAGNEVWLTEFVPPKYLSKN